MRRWNRRRETGLAEGLRFKYQSDGTSESFHPSDGGDRRSSGSVHGEGGWLLSGFNVESASQFAVRSSPFRSPSDCDTLPIQQLLFLTPCWTVLQLAPTRAISLRFFYFYHYFLKLFFERKDNLVFLKKLFCHFPPKKSVSSLFLTHKRQVGHYGKVRFVNSR